MPAISFPIESIAATCDRCGRIVEGFRQGALTSGYYDMTHPRWSVFARDGERVLCARCLETDSFYMATFIWTGGER